MKLTLTTLDHKDPQEPQTRPQIKSVFNQTVSEEMLEAIFNLILAAEMDQKHLKNEIKQKLELT